MKYKVGDEVVVVECETLKKWGSWKECVNKTCIITEIDGGTYILDDNRYSINFKVEMIRSLKIDNWKEEIENV